MFVYERVEGKRGVGGLLYSTARMSAVLEVPNKVRPGVWLFGPGWLYHVWHAIGSMLSLIFPILEL